MENKNEKIVILGFGGHAKSIADSILRNGYYQIVGYTDKRDCNNCFTYLGSDEVLEYVYRQGVHKAALGVGFMGKSRIRDELVSIAKDIGFEFPAIIDHSAILAENVQIGEGTFIGKRAVINADSKIGEYCIVNSGAIIEHDNKIDDYSHVAIGSILCGNITIGNHTFVGAGTTIIQGKVIGDNCVLGANSTVLSNVESNVKCYGIVDLN